MADSHAIACADGTFPEDWPTCAVRCAIPAPEGGYAAHADQGKGVETGESVVFECATAGETVGDTLQTTHSIRCGADGTFPTGWPTCAVKCPVPDPEEG